MSKTDPDSKYNILKKFGHAIIEHAQITQGLVFSYSISQLIEPLLNSYVPSIDYKLYNNISINSHTLLRPASVCILNAGACLVTETILSKISSALAPPLNLDKKTIELIGRAIGLSVASQITGYNPWFVGSIILASLISNKVASGPTTESNINTIPQKIVANSLSSSIGSAIKFTTRLAASSILNVQRPVFDALASSIDKVTAKVGKKAAQKFFPSPPVQDTQPQKAKTSALPKKKLVSSPINRNSKRGIAY